MMAGPFDDSYPPNGMPGLLGGFGNMLANNGPMMMALGAGLLGGQGWHGAMQAGLQAQQAARRDAIQAMTLHNRLMNGRGIRSAATGPYGVQPAWGPDLGGGG